MKCLFEMLFCIVNLIIAQMSWQFYEPVWLGIIDNTRELDAVTIKKILHHRQFVPSQLQTFLCFLQPTKSTVFGKQIHLKLLTFILTPNRIREQVSYVHIYAIIKYNPAQIIPNNPIMQCFILSLFLIENILVKTLLDGNTYTFEHPSWWGLLVRV